MPGHPQRFWLAALCVAWSVDLLFWNNQIGVSFPIFIALAIGLGFWLLYSEGTRLSRPSVALVVLALLLALVTIWRVEPMTRFLNAAMALGLMLLLAMTLRVPDWLNFSVFDYVLSGMYLLAAAFVRAARLRLLPAPTENSGTEAAARQVWRRTLPVVRGLALAIPVVAVMGGLLSAADPIFSDTLTRFFKLFDLNRLPEYLFRLSYVLILAYAFAGTYLHAIHPQQQMTASAPRSSLRFLGSTEAIIVLVSVNLLFALFVAIQFRYFFGGQANISETGYTYSDYARRGFFELVTVAVLSLMMSLSLGAVTRRETTGQYRTFTAMSILLVALVWVMLVSAFLRLQLYEDAYGFTRLRTYTHIFIPWLGLLLLATIVFQVMRRERWFNVALLLAVIGFCLTFPLVNVDRFIAQQNIQRANRGAELDEMYLLQLSEDALPVIIGQYQAPASETVREALGAVLACWQWGVETTHDDRWQAYHPGIAAARQQLKLVKLDVHAVPDDRGPAYVDFGKAQRLYCSHGTRIMD